MKIFITHLSSEINLANKIKSELELREEKVINTNLDTSTKFLSSRLKNRIDLSEMNLVILSKQALESSYLTKHIEYIQKTGKPLVVLVEKNFEDQVPLSISPSQCILFENTMHDELTEEIMECIYEPSFKRDAKFYDGQ